MRDDGSRVPADRRPSRTAARSACSDQLVPQFSRAVASLDHAASAELDRAGVDPSLRELVRLRASQLNGCAYCVDMHTKDGRANGEERLGAVFALVVAINVWNTIGVTTRCWTVHRDAA